MGNIFPHLDGPGFTTCFTRIAGDMLDALNDGHGALSPSFFRRNSRASRKFLL
jgi:hypothetical protein